MGDRDFVKPLLESRGKVHFGKVRIKPEHSRVAWALAHVVGSTVGSRPASMAVVLKQEALQVPTSGSRASSVWSH